MRKGKKKGEKQNVPWLMGNELYQIIRQTFIRLYFDETWEVKVTENYNNI